MTFAVEMFPIGSHPVVLELGLQHIDVEGIHA